MMISGTILNTYLHKYEKKILRFIFYRIRFVFGLIILVQFVISV